MKNIALKQFLKEKHITEYDFICSIGAACPCSQALRKAGMVFNSYPFDWLFEENDKISNRLDIICNEFNGWFEKDNLVFSNTREHPHPCNVYKNTKTGIIFNHDFPIDKNLDNYYDVVNEKYNRRINRLYESINNNQKILLVYLAKVPTDTSTTKEPQSGFETKLKELRQKFPSKDIDLLYIYPSEDNSYSYKQDNGIIKIGVGNSSTKKETTNDVQSPDIIAKILKKNIKLKDSFTKNLKRLILIKLGNLIFIRKWRKKFKRHYHLY